MPPSPPEELDGHCERYDTGLDGPLAWSSNALIFLLFGFTSELNQLDLSGRGSGLFYPTSRKSVILWTTSAAEFIIAFHTESQG